MPEASRDAGAREDRGGSSTNSCAVRQAAKTPRCLIRQHLQKPEKGEIFAHQSAADGAKGGRRTDVYSTEAT